MAEHETNPSDEPKTLAEYAAEAAGDVRGIACVKCHKTAWRVYYTRLGLGIVKRKRVCLCCGHEIVTHEKPIGQADKPELNPN